MKKHERMKEIYESGAVPWDQTDPPPEVMDLVAHLPAGRALDLGCGYGRATIYLAQLGWQVDGVDFVAQAIDGAKLRAVQAGVSDRAHFFQSGVTQLDYLEKPYDFALDVGCAHSLTLKELQAYYQELLRLLKPGAIFMLFAHLNEETDEREERNWMDETALRTIFAEGFHLEKAEYGQTQVNDQTPWRSAWFWFRKDA
ncbi:MAG: class I SAM-dependent methyltransferase [Chloroflexi bacterium HGW-Chloroflexi-3]|nr:MAG: class I SAM-dependent methyltransferase [Chloroflexi bacterium HGW-Chloroflexi-3]